MHSPLVVVGGGPGGYAAAFLAADKGLEVTLIEAEPRLGGTCLLRGCIPSKALLHVARVMGEVEELREDWGVDFNEPTIHVDKLRERKQQVITNLSGGLKQLVKRRKVNVITARGILDNARAIRLEGDDDSIPADRQVTFDHLIIATGSSPAMPPAGHFLAQRLQKTQSVISNCTRPRARGKGSRFSRRVAGLLTALRVMSLPMLKRAMLLRRKNQDTRNKTN